MIDTIPSKLQINLEFSIIYIYIYIYIYIEFVEASEVALVVAISSIWNSSSEVSEGEWSVFVVSR